MKAGIRPRVISDPEGSCERRPGGSLRESREAWFDRLTTLRKIEGKEVAEAQSNKYEAAAVLTTPCCVT